jgi:SAM-dependent methyltransferase
VTATRKAAGYALDNDEPAAKAMLDALSDTLDRISQPRLIEVLARLPEEAERFWVPGAGNGSMSAWLADYAGPRAVVIASDIKPQHVRPHPQVRTLTHDLVRDPALSGPCHGIYCRCLIPHLHDPEAIVAKLVKVLPSGGALIIEDMGAAGQGQVLRSADPDLPFLYSLYQQGLLGMLTALGNDTSWALRAPLIMEAAGLTGVQTETRALSWRGGEAGCRLPIALSRQKQPELIATGNIDAAGLDQLRLGLADPGTVVLGNTLFSHVGYRP